MYKLMVSDKDVNQLFLDYANNKFDLITLFPFFKKNV